MGRGGTSRSTNVGHQNIPDQISGLKPAVWVRQFKLHVLITDKQNAQNMLLCG